ncbi:H-NS histone family protein [Comamonas terrigena]|uniref:H-NS histone family protein n=1 Tax=Comamonas terrigena TaxID=32013 RepID=UPI0024480565|nr:H-NS histone family protein [Comamonas terrigena]MDH1293812.1 H-NS histone family protein [Comamonas terrigena]
MSTYKKLLQQIIELDAQIAEAHTREKSRAVTQARELVQQFGLTVNDVFGKYTSSGTRTITAQGSTATPKYRDPVTGATWTGRGREPLWIKGKDRAAFAI